MASGTIYGSTGNQYIDCKIEWEYSQNTSTNTSTVTAALFYKRNNTGFTTQGTGTFKISIGGTVTSESKHLTITENAWVKAVEATKTISHNSDGTKSVVLSASGSIPSTTLTSTSCSGTVKLATIPRASTLDSLSCATKYFNGKMTYKYTPKSASYYNRCNISLNLNGEYIAVKSIDLGKQSITQKTATVTLSEDELSIIYNELPNTTKGTLRFTFRTYLNSDYSSQVGDAGYKEITLDIPNISATQPTVTMTLSPVSSLASPFNTLYIKGRSKVDANFSNGAGKYGASIVSYKMRVSGKSYNSPYTSGYLSTSGSVTVKGTVTDSRGYSRTYSKTITVIDYTEPTILPASDESQIICARCDSNGNISESGTYLKIKAKRSYSKVTSSGVQKNYCSIRYQYKVASATKYSDWITILTSSSLSSDEVETDALLGGALSATSSYMVRVGVVDDIGEEANTTIIIPTDKPYMHRAGSINALGIGKYAEEKNTVDIADDINIYGRVYGLGKAKVALREGEDVNSFLDFGVYAVTSNAIAKTIVNIPIQSAGRLIVSSGNASGKRSGTYTYILQEYITLNGYYHCYREAYTSDDASEWFFNKWEIRSSTFWKDLGLSDEVSASSVNVGRFTNGSCYYRVVNENHVYVAFNCAFAYNGSPITVSGSQIPSPYKPARNAYAYCTTNGRGLARIFINTSGDVRIDHVQNMATAEATSSYTVNWIDGYIDYWV